MLVPPLHADTGIVPVHAAQLSALFDVPDLHLAGAQADANVGAVATPLDAADVRVGGGLEQAVDRARLGGPDVHVPLEADSDLVARAPVEQVQVVIIDEAGSIQDTLGGGEDPSAELSRDGVCVLEGPIVLRAEVNGL